ncbi:hypothetical protein E1A91_A09G254800v1 [Gossypium mustelinum]|uniref:Uncharacterized protein n=2 Tax=Gossypium TaxID=3633 RepID=A0A5D2Y259_GOSMU|nr:hypothetical protein ES288_A09G275100v1 [Gossypium darwinii]TYJ20303.1 hypothetical protein E1A91_A09G254800v1 [Gossypium mustelinum]
MATSMSEPTDVLQHVAIEIPKGSYDSLVIPLKEKMETMTTASCIFKVDEKLREIDEKHYLPQTVSIGLFHHGRDNTKFMEEHKWRYLYSLLNRKSHLEATLDKCVKSLRELEHKARLCYKDLKQDEVPSDKLVEIMLADAGFLIELFLKYVIKGLKRRGDYVFNTSGLLYELRCDMLLLENQIPYFILQRLFEIVPIPNHCKLSLTELAFRFFRDMIPGDHRLHLAKFGQEGNHFLDLIRHCFLPTVPRIKAKQQEEVRGLPYKASKLKDAGIKLKKATTEDLLDIKFVKGVLEIPPINVHQYTETLLRNLIAIEQSGPGTTNHISSYVFLMKTLLPENKDVKLVKRKQILTNYDVNDKKQVETLFHRLCEEMKVMENADDEFYYNGLCEQVKEYKKSSWKPRLKTMTPPFKPGYLQRPLPRIVIVLLVLFIVLVFVGALFSVISFFRHKL